MVSDLSLTARLSAAHRHTAGMLRKQADALAESVTDLLVRQKQISLGVPSMWGAQRESIISVSRPPFEYSYLNTSFSALLYTHFLVSADHTAPVLPAVGSRIAPCYESPSALSPQPGFHFSGDVTVMSVNVRRAYCSCVGVSAVLLNQRKTLTPKPYKTTRMSAGAQAASRDPEPHRGGVRRRPGRVGPHPGAARLSGYEFSPFR